MAGVVDAVIMVFFAVMVVAVLVFVGMIRVVFRAVSGGGFLNYGGCPELAVVLVVVVIVAGTTGCVNSSRGSILLLLPGNS